MHRTAVMTPWSKALNQASSVRSSNRPALEGPTALTSAFTSPHRAPIWANAAATSASTAASAAIATVSVAPAAEMVSLAWSNDSLWRPRRAILPPSAESRTAVARPVPVDPPLMTLTAPVVIAFSFSRVLSYSIDIQLLQRGGMTEKAGRVLGSAGAVLDRALETDPAREALISIDARLSYEELDLAVERAARALAA